MFDKHFGRFLIEMGFITEEQFNIAHDVQRVKNGSLTDILQSLAFLSSKEAAIASAKQAKLEYLDISGVKPSFEILKLFDANTLKNLLFIPFEKVGSDIHIAVVDPYDVRIADAVRITTGCRAVVFVSEKENILRSIEIGYYLIDKAIKDDITKLSVSEHPDTPTILDLIFKYAVTENATDIHISPEADCAHIFLRKDGIMRHEFAVPQTILNSLISRIKILSELDISEQRIPQDGSMSVNFFGENFDIRVSTIPTAYGENAVLRILGKNLSLFSLESLGFDQKTKDRLEKCFARPHGIFLVTGPTGSGKTTTLYSALRRINALQRRVLTVEDPIEYRFPFIKQTQINEKAGYGFSDAMRAFLRQDPDVILLGEMRDRETAEIAMRAAITGHLVLSTMHTNDAVTAIPRLLDLGVKDYLIASGVSGILAQRLVRKVCPFCSLDTEINSAELGMDETSKIIVKKEKGCRICGETGYSGRTVISEFLEANEEIQDMIIKGATPNEIQNNARKQGMRSMFENGLEKVRNGITTLNEIKRVASE